MYEQLRNQSDLKYITSWLNFSCLKVHSESLNESTLKKVKFVRECKLFKLGYDNFNESLDVEKIVFIFSSVNLSLKLKQLLASGLKFGIPLPKSNFAHFFLTFEKLLRPLCKPSSRIPNVHNHIKSNLI